MIRQTLRALIQIVGGLGAGMAIVLGYAGWKLSSGPITLPFLTPYIETALSPEEAGFKVTISETILTWQGWRRNLDVRLKGARVLDSEGALIAGVPELSLSASARALLKGIFAPRDIELFSPRLRLVRNADGDITVGFGDEAEKGKEAASDAFKAILEKVVNMMSSPPDPEKPLTYIRRVSIVNADFVIIDIGSGRSWVAPSSEFYIRRDKEGLHAEASMALDVDGQSFQMTSVANYGAENKRVDFGIDFNRIVPAAVAKLMPNLSSLAEVKFPVGGTVAGTLTTEWGLDELTFSLHGGKGELGLPHPVEQVLQVDEALFDGLYDRDTGEITVNEFALLLAEGTQVQVPEPIAHAMPLRSVSGSLSYHRAATGHLSLPKLVFDLAGPQAELTARIDGIGGELSLEAKGTLSGVPMDRVADYWPKSMGEDAWLWVTENLSDGEISKAYAEVSAKVDGEGEVSITHLAGEMDAEGVTVDYLPPMPKGRDAKAHAVFDTKRFDIQILNGKSKGLSVKEGFVNIRDLDKYDQTAEIKLLVEGPIQDALELIDSEPLGFASELGIDPKRTSGRASAELNLAFLLIDDLRFDQVDVSARAELRDVAIQDVILGLGISKGKMTLNADREKMDIGGVSTIGTIPVALRWRENFSSNAPFVSRYSLHGEVDQKQLTNELKLDFPPFSGGYLNGVTAADVIVTRFKGDKAKMTAALDLAETDLALPLFKWRKEKRAPGKAKVEISIENGVVRRVDHFDVKTEKLTADGRIVLKPNGDGLKEVRLNQLKKGRTSVRGVVVPDGKGGWDVDLDGEGLDLTPVRRSLFDAQKGALAKMGDTKMPPLLFSFSLGNVWLGPERLLKQATGAFAYDGNVWRSAVLQGTVGQGKTVRLLIQPSGDKRTLLITSDDAGASLNVLDLMDNMTGGELELTGTFDDTLPNSPLTGRLNVSDFRVTRMPVLAHLVSLIGLTGILEAIGGEGLSFNTLDAPFQHNHGVLELNDARANGTSLGLTASGKIYTDAEFIDLKGTIVPAYLVNSFLGKIPLIGGLFSGGEEGGGMFAANYQVTGALTKPVAKVDPLTALAPSFLRNIFRGADVLPPAYEGDIDLPSYHVE